VTTDPVTTDEELMLEIQRGAGGAFDELFARYREPVWGFFRRRVPDARRAEELAQDTFLAILEAVSRYEPRRPFRSYVFGIAYKVLFSDRRRAASRTATPLGSDPAAAGADPDVALWVKAALAKLDSVDREILMLREYEQLSYREIADVRGMPLNTVRSRLFRARMALRGLLEARAVGVGHESR
jgi:RNA polymerase sigma factor (sigma-70 family)